MPSNDGLRAGQTEEFVPSFGPARIPRRAGGLHTVGFAESVAAAIALAVPFYFRSLDSGSGRAVAALIMALLLFLLLLRPVKPQFWAAIAPVLLLAGIADLWVLLLPVMAGGQQLAPDLAMANIVGFHAGAL